MDSSSLPGLDPWIFQEYGSGLPFPSPSKEGELEPQGRVGTVQDLKPREGALPCPCPVSCEPHPECWLTCGAECLAKAEGCWKSGCFLGRCLACPFESETEGDVPGEGRQELLLLWGCEWNPLLSQAFSQWAFTQPTMAGWCQGWVVTILYTCLLVALRAKFPPAGHSSF